MSEVWKRIKPKDKWWITIGGSAICQRATINRIIDGKIVSLTIHPESGKAKLQYVLLSKVNFHVEW